MCCIHILLLVFGPVALSAPLYDYPYGYYYPRGYGYYNYGNNYRVRRDTEVVLRYNTPNGLNSQSAMTQYPSAAYLPNTQVPPASVVVNPSVYATPNENTYLPVSSSLTGAYGLSRYRRDAVVPDAIVSPARLTTMNNQVPVFSEITSSVPFSFVSVPIARYIPFAAGVPM